MAKDQAAVLKATANYLKGKVENGETEVGELLYNDQVQFFVKLMALAGLSPNSNYDNEANGYQFIEALDKRNTIDKARNFAINFKLSFPVVPGATISIPYPYGYDYKYGKFIGIIYIDPTTGTNVFDINAAELTDLSTGKTLVSDTLVDVIAYNDRIDIVADGGNVVDIDFVNISLNINLISE